ncbi:hypothetical protein [Gaetbulibacter aestuarii]|uniref:Lipoprotein n=1 Tax=Gaetbulibacter aestuarii TaxID=1502358 RepID=A0ABW7MZ98_9FLAO
MKRFILISILFVLLASCSKDDYPVCKTDFMPVENVDIPQEFALGEVYPITVYYYQPTSCYKLFDLYYRIDNNIRIVAPINCVESGNCEQLDNVLADVTFNFLVTSNGSYVFKFWQGKDSNGDDVYLTIEVPVTG